MGSAYRNNVNASVVCDMLNQFPGMSVVWTGSPLLQSLDVSDWVGYQLRQLRVALWIAAADFCAYEIYKIEGLGLLDSYTCTAASCWKSIEEDGQLEGSATISGMSGGLPVNFKTPRFTFIPCATGAPGSSCLAIPATATIVDHMNLVHTISCTIQGDDINHVTVLEDQGGPPPAAPSDSYDDDDNVPV
jgi:hypothetical protein